MSGSGCDSCSSEMWECDVSSCLTDAPDYITELETETSGEKKYRIKKNNNILARRALIGCIFLSAKSSDNHMQMEFRKFYSGECFTTLFIHIYTFFYIFVGFDGSIQGEPSKQKYLNLNKTGWREHQFL